MRWCGIELRNKTEITSSISGKSGDSCVRVCVWLPCLAVLPRPKLSRHSNDYYTYKYIVYYYYSSFLSATPKMRGNESLTSAPFVFWGMNFRSSQAKTNAKNANEALAKITNRWREKHSMKMINNSETKEEILFTALALTFGAMPWAMNSRRWRANTHRFIHRFSCSSNWSPAHHLHHGRQGWVSSIPWFCAATEHNGHFEIYRMMDEQVEYSNFEYSTNEIKKLARGSAALNMHTAAMRCRY